MSNINVPKAIEIKRGSRVLMLTYADGSVLSLPFEYLRVYSPSAEVRGHGAGEGKLVTGKAEVMLTGAEAVGNYALKLTFDDGHDSGLFSWDYFRELAMEYEARWKHYLARLDAAGQSRQAPNPGSPQHWNG